MKLLEKKIIEQQRSSERKTEIDEGVKLARKIDVLRETVASEEVRLAKFRIASLRKTQEQIDDLIAKKTSLEQSITVLKEEKKALQVPLDNEWEKINQKEAELIEYATKLNDKTVALRQRDKDNALKGQELKIEEKRIADEKHRTLINLAKSDENCQKTARIALETTEKGDRILAELTKKNQDILSREAQVAVREREVQLARENNEKISKALAIKERQVNDKYATLQRTLERIKVKKIKK